MTEEQGESIEQKKERMQRYMDADRKLEAEKDKRARRRSRGCLTNLVFVSAKVALVVGLIAGVGYLIWLWHPWDTEIVTTPASERPGTCSEGVEGVYTAEHLRIFGVRVMKSGQSTICME